MSNELHTSNSGAMKVSAWSIIANLGLTVFKILAGIFGKSAAMVSDGIHSATDAVSTVMVMISMRMAAREADDGHQYGHERLEAIAAILLAVALALTGVGIGWSGIQTILRMTGPEAVSDAGNTAEIPGVLALIAAAVSILVKEIMYHVTAHTARRIGSTAMMADAWHHRSDALSSIGSLVGVLLARFGYAWGDPAASIIISLMIIKAGIDIFRAAAAQLTDHAAEPELEHEMRATICSVAGVVRVDLLHTRCFASRVYADVEIAADGDLPLRESHAIAENVHDLIEKTYPQVKHCMVHVNPA